MSVSQPLGTSLEARSSWCQPNEPIIWTFPQASLRYDVEGLDLVGKPLPGWGARTGKNTKRAASAVGGTVLDMGLTAVFGGGGEPGRNVGGKTRDDLPDVIVFGGHPDSKAARLLSLGELARILGSSEVTLDSVRADWVLTPQRLSLVTTAENEDKPEKQQEGKSTDRLLKRAKAYTAEKSDKFGPNPPKKPLRTNSLRSLFDIERHEIVGFDVPFRELGSEFRQNFCFRIVLDDDSGFDLHKKYTDPNHMMEMTMGRA